MEFRRVLFRAKSAAAMVQMKIEKIVRVFANVSPIFAAIKNRAARTTIAPYPRNIWSALMLLRHGDFRRERVSIREKDRPELQTDQRMIVGAVSRSEEHTSELQSLMRISYAVF